MICQLINLPKQISAIRSWQDRIGAYQTRGLSGGALLNTVKMNYRRIEGKTDIAKTLMSRDYKCFNTGFDTQNGIIEECQNQES